MIYINFVDLHSLMLHARFQHHSPWDDLDLFYGKVNLGRPGDPALGLYTCMLVKQVYWYISQVSIYRTIGPLVLDCESWFLIHEFDS